MLFSQLIFTIRNTYIYKNNKSHPKFKNLTKNNGKCIFFNLRELFRKFKAIHMIGTHLVIEQK